MPSQKISGMDRVVAPTEYDYVAGITPTYNSAQPYKNTAIPVRSIWAPTMLVELRSDSNDVAEALNNWYGTTVLESADCLWDGVQKQFQFTVPGVYEVTVVGETYPVDVYEATGGANWPNGHILHDIYLDRGYTEIVPRDASNHETHRTRSRVSDSYTNVGPIGFSERFYFNVASIDDENIGFFTPYAITRTSASTVQNYRSRMAVAAKRIGEAIANLAVL